MRPVAPAGIQLLKHFEGFRARAYRDAVGVWTIGYGHTAAAGAPRPKDGDQITEAEAQAILTRDLADFARDVEDLTPHVFLNDNQFAAMVSFAYNVGIGNFQRSSVLDAIQRNDFDAVPRRLALWVKAGGRTLPGLVKRRAAEALLFQRDYRNMRLFEQGIPLPTEHEVEAMQAARSNITPVRGKSLSESTTVWATITSAAAGVSAAVREATWTFNDLQGFVPEKVLPWLLCAVVIAGCAGYVIRERHRKSEDDGI